MILVPSFKIKANMKWLRQSTIDTIHFIQNNSTTKRSKHFKLRLTLHCRNAGWRNCSEHLFFNQHLYNLPGGRALKPALRQCSYVSRNRSLRGSLMGGHRKSQQRINFQHFILQQKLFMAGHFFYFFLEWSFICRFVFFAVFLQFCISVWLDDKKRFG